MEQFETFWFLDAFKNVSTYEINPKLFLQKSRK